MATHTIYPYIDAQLGQLVFDEPDLGILGEPFIDGMDAMLLELARRDGVDRPGDGFGLRFSDEPGLRHVITLKSQQPDGCYYRSEELGMTGWLCPVTRMFFNGFPPHIYAEAFPAQVRKLQHPNSPSEIVPPPTDAPGPIPFG
jgi:hypothetical protein